MSVMKGSRLMWAVSLLSATMACSNGTITSPTSTSVSDGPGALTTIKGTTQESSAMQTASTHARHSSTGVQICVSGSTTCTTVGSTGEFELVGNFSGDVRLEITGPDGTVTLTIPHVEHGETIVVLVNLNGSAASLRVLSRTGEDDGEDDDEDDKDDDDNDDDEDDDEDDDDHDDDDGDHGDEDHEGSRDGEDSGRR